MSANASTSAKDVQSHYTGRAANYDEMNGGWHIELGKDFVEWLSPIQHGSVALDLACGTGLVTIPLASAIGPSGKALAVDMTKVMLDQARLKPLPADSGTIEWIKHDIIDLSALPEVQNILHERGGFDIISCCSALVLLPSPSAAIESWSELLKPGGRMIIDVPTEDKTLQHIVSVDMKEILGLPNELGQSWIEGVHSLEKVFEEAGLTVEESYKTKNYVETLETKIYEGNDGEKIWEEHIEKLRDFVHLEVERQEEARAAFLKLWKNNLGEDGKFRDGNSLYVVVGRKE